MAAAKRDYQPWNVYRQTNKILQVNFEQDRWELYDVARDFSEARDLAAANPAKLAELKAEFDKEARRNLVYPLVPTPQGAPTAYGKRTSFRFPGDTSALPQSAIPDLSNRSHRIEADLLVPENGAEGVIVAEGGRYGGFSLYVKDGRLHYENNSFGHAHQVIAAPTALPKGLVKVAYEFAPDPAGAQGGIFTQARGGSGRLFVAGKLVAEGHLNRFGAFGYDESLDIGRDRGSPVSKHYAAPFAFTGKVQEVRLEVGQ